MIQKQTWTYVTTNSHVVRDAHTKDTDITCLHFSTDGRTLLSRAMDHTLKIWDIRKVISPVSVIGELPNFNSQTTCSFSPNERLIVTGVSLEDDSGSGHLAFIDPTLGSVVRKTALEKSVVVAYWHDRLNQIIVGGGKNVTNQIVFQGS